MRKRALAERKTQEETPSQPLTKDFSSYADEQGRTLRPDLRCPLHRPSSNQKGGQGEKGGASTPSGPTSGTLRNVRSSEGAWGAHRFTLRLWLGA